MLANIVPSPVVVVYTGQDITTIPRNVTHLVVAPNVTTIEAFAFCQCHSLMSVDFHIGLEVIAEFAFGYCTSLEKVRFPSTMRVVGRHVFSNCSRLKHVELNEGLLVLRDGVFSFCLSLKRLRIPSTVTEIERELLYSCTALETVELPPNNTIQSVEELAFGACNMLKNLILPRSTEQNNNVNVAENVFPDCLHLHMLLRIAIGQHGEVNNSTLLRFFEQRFTLQPIHELCYYESYRPIFETIGDIQKLLSLPDSEYGPLDEEGKLDQCPTDLFQMTPFHVLALSSKPNYHLLVTLQRIFPLSAQSEKDVNGITPIEYIMNNIDSLEERSGVLQCLIQSTILDRLEGRYAPEQEIKEIVQDLYGTADPLEWKTMVRYIYKRLSKVERHEGLSLLELSIWKSKLKAVNQSLSAELLRPTQAIHLSDDEGEDERSQNKRARIYSRDPILDRHACRVNCGADVIIGNVLPYLPSLS